MEREQDGVNYVIEWSIENFSCWNREIHGSVIQSPKSCSFGSLYLELYPRGTSGDDEHLVVHINGGGWAVLGELSYIGPDGSLLCRQKVDSQEKNVVKLPFGPKFQEVISRIKKNEALHMDRITVRYLRSYHKNYTECMQTVINVFEVSFEIPHKTLDNLDSVEKSIVWINCLEDEKGRGRIELSAFKDSTNFSKIFIQLELLYFKKKVLVLTHMFALNNDDGIVKTEDNEHIFLDDTVWNFSTLTSEEMKDLQKSRTSLILSLKIIPSINYWHSLGLLRFQDRKVDILSSNCFMPYSTSVSARKSLRYVASNQRDDLVTILANELMCLYQDQDFSDFQLKCDNISFPVHKAILSARSPVFKTMLSTDMKEAVSGCMDIVDLDPSTLGLFLTYLYTGVVEELQSERALKLYYAADKYQVPSLKRECAYFLSANVSISNVCDVLSLANKHQDDQLIAVAHELILNNYNDVLSSDEWKSLMRSEPFLVAETLTHFAEKKYVGKSDVHKN